MSKKTILGFLDCSNRLSGISNIVRPKRSLYLHHVQDAYDFQEGGIFQLCAQRLLILIPITTLPMQNEWIGTNTRARFINDFFKPACSHTASYESLQRLGAYEQNQNPSK